MQVAVKDEHGDALGAVEDDEEVGEDSVERAQGQEAKDPGTAQYTE
jgi:hypothetical protein